MGKLQNQKTTEQDSKKFDNMSIKGNNERFTDLSSALKANLKRRKVASKSKKQQDITQE